VQDEQVDLVDAELAGNLLRRVQGGVVPVVADPHLRLQHHLLTRNPAAAQTFTDLPLVSVRGGGVNVTVADLERGPDGGNRLGWWGLEDTEADGGQGDAV
jgi:hypothetical protein